VFNSNTPNQHLLLTWTFLSYLKLWLCGRQTAQHISWSQGCFTSLHISEPISQTFIPSINHTWYKFRETYHTENTKTRETKRDETEKLFIEIENQTNWALMEAYREREVFLEERRQKYLGAPSRSQQSF